MTPPVPQKIQKDREHTTASMSGAISALEIMFRCACHRGWMGAGRRWWTGAAAAALETHEGVFEAHVRLVDEGLVERLRVADCRGKTRRSDGGNGDI